MRDCRSTARNSSSFRSRRASPTPSPDEARKRTDALQAPPGKTSGPKNEILYSLNKPDEFILAIVGFLPNETHRVHYLRRPFRREPDFGVTSVNYDFGELLARTEEPRYEPHAGWKQQLPSGYDGVQGAR
jgi:hypothetical protein